MLQLSLGDNLGQLVFQFSFWVPPTQWEEIDKTRGRVTRITPIFAHARERVGTQCGRGKLYPPDKNKAEQANIRHHFIQKVEELDIEHHLPWRRGMTGIMLVGQELPPATDYWVGKPHTKKPDNSNMLKQFEDAINPDKKTGFCGAYPDDCWVEPLYQTKQYGSPEGVLCTLFWFEQPMVNRPVKVRQPRRVTTLS